MGWPLICDNSKTCVKRPLKNRQNKDLNDKWGLNASQKYCRMVHLEHSAILVTCIKRYWSWKPMFSRFESGFLHRFYCIVPPVFEIVDVYLPVRDLCKGLDGPDVH